MAAIAMERLITGTTVATVTSSEPPQARAPFLSFWQSGFEGADHLNGSARPLCMNSMTDHYRQAPSDYGRLAVMGLKTVRESASWRQIDRKGRFDFRRVQALCRHAKERGLQLMWTCFHYGVPPDVDIFSESFPRRFADYCNALAHVVRRSRHNELPQVYTPINEISFLAWAICETGLIHPHLGTRAEDGFELKKRLVRASIMAADAILEADPDARFLIVDPLVHSSPACEEERDAARLLDSYQFQAWDMLAGKLEPGLGGSPKYLDLVGANYYPSNQWDHSTRQMLEWPGDPRRKRLSEMLVDLHRRYRRPLALSETSHTGSSRGPWLREVVAQVSEAMQAGADVRGICLYPALDRPDWEQPTHWHDSGMWHVHPRGFRRRIYADYAEALRQARVTLAGSMTDFFISP
jgi:UDP-galactopyranose mutase